MYPTPDLPRRKVELRLDKLCSQHGIIPDTWDERRNDTGHEVLTWTERDLGLVVIVALAERWYTVDIERQRRYREGIRTAQRVRVTNDYDVPTSDLRTVFFEIRQHRAKKKASSPTGPTPTETYAGDILTSSGPACV